MPISFIHLSDIHFGQEKGSKIIIHDDVKNRLIEDAVELVSKYADGCATGIIITGDIAYSGKSEEYKCAAKWLDRLAAAINCNKTSVQIVPGNHDIDRERISVGCKLMLKEIATRGETALDEILERETDRENFYHRFKCYRTFAEGYNCPLDSAGGIASDRCFELAPNRSLRFIGLNSALICSGNDKKGRLLLGARQHVLPRNAGEELVVLCHHPLDWLQDSTNSRNYIRSRARVFISGHEHNPSVRVEARNGKNELVMLSAGATIPPTVEDGYNFTYSLLVFDWHSHTENLQVTIVSRAWSSQNTCFEGDDVNFVDNEQTFELDCPNFQKDIEETRLESKSVVATVHKPDKNNLHTNEFLVGESNLGEVVTDSYPLVLLRFFRDLLPDQRIAVLVKLGALPNEWHDSLTHNIERQLIDALVRSGQIDEIEAAIDEIQTQNE